MTEHASPWWTPHVHADRRPHLLARGRIKAATLAWFAGEGFTEVECAILQVSPGNETHLSAFATERIDPDGTRETLYLHTSPEFAAKKLLAAGEERIVTLGSVFRNREHGPRHANEFAMLEWYRARAPYTALMADCAALLAEAARAAGTSMLSHRGRTCDPFAEPERLSVADAFARHAGIDLLATVDATGATDRDALAAAAEKAGLRVAADDDWGDIFSRVISERVEPHLGIGRGIGDQRLGVGEFLDGRPVGLHRIDQRRDLGELAGDLHIAFGRDLAERFGLEGRVMREQDVQFGFRE